MSATARDGEKGGAVSISFIISGDRLFSFLLRFRFPEHTHAGGFPEPVSPLQPRLSGLAWALMYDFNELRREHVCTSLCGLLRDEAMTDFLSWS